MSDSDLEKKLDEALGIDESPAAPIAPTPTRPARPAPARPAPSRPAPTRPTPFNPPKPKVVPTPKNKVDVVHEMVCEAYEDEAHPSTQQFWSGLPQNREHLFAKHPILSLYGDELSRGSWSHTAGKAREAGISTQQLMQVMMQIRQIERGHEAELVDLAKKITVKIWDIPMDMLQGDLTGDVEQNEESDEEYGQEVDLGQTVGRDVHDQINKRLTMNAMTQGSAVHAMLSIHHVVDKEVNTIDPRLLQLYTKLSAGAHEYYWLIDIPAMFAHLGMQAVGSARVDYGEEEDEMETPEMGQPTVVAKGVIFPILAQEMSKGVAELISHHGLSDMDEPTTRAVLNKADDIRHEPYLIQIGPELWRRFLKVKPRDVGLSEVMTALALQTPAEVHKIIAAVVENSEIASELVHALIEDPESFDIEDDPLSYDDPYDDGAGGDYPENDFDDRTGEEWKQR